MTRSHGGRIRWITLFGILTLAGACGVLRPGPARRLQTPILVSDLDGRRLALLRPYGAGYRYEDAAGAVGKLTLEAGRVKIQDAAGTRLAKSKLDESGLMIYDARDQPVLKVKVRAGVWELKRGDGTSFGRVKDDRISLEPGRITIRAGATESTVKRDGAERLRVSSEVPIRSALLLGLDELGLPERLVAMIATVELLPPREAAPAIERVR